MNLYEIQTKHGEYLCLQLAKTKQDALDIAREFYNSAAAYAEAVQINMKVKNENTAQKT